jgi:hypothetical protein
MMFYYYMLLVKSLNVKVSLMGTTLLLLVAASLSGFNPMTPPTMASASLTVDDTTGGVGTSAPTTMANNTSLSANTTSIELSDEPFAVGHYRTVSDNMTSEGQVQFRFEGNTTITLPNSTETITTRDTGEGTFSFLPGGAAGSPRGQIHMTTEDGSESVSGNFTEFIRFEESTGIGIAYLSTNSTGMLAPLNNMIAVFLDEIQPNEDSTLRFFEWKSGGVAPIDNSNATTISGGNDNTTMTASETTVSPTS